MPLKREDSHMLPGGADNFRELVGQNAGNCYITRKLHSPAFSLPEKQFTCGTLAKTPRWAIFEWMFPT